MKFSAPAGTLREVFSLMRSACDPNASLVAYSGCRIRVDDTGVTVCGGDGDLSVLARIPEATVLEHGEAVVTPKPVYDLAGSEDGAKLMTVSTSEDNASLTIAIAGRRPYRFRAIATTYPDPLSPTSAAVPAELGELERAVHAVRAAAGVAPAGIQIVSSSAGLRLAATDNYRLHVATLPRGGFGDFSAVVPLAVLDSAVRWAPDRIAFEVGGKVLGLIGDRVAFTTRLLSTQFPAIESVLAGEAAATVAVKSTDLRTALSRLAAVSNTAPVVISVSDGTMTLNASDAEVGEGEEEIAVVSGSGEVDTIRFAADRSFLADAVTAHGDGVIQMAWRGDLTPVVLNTPGSVAVTTVVMPIQI